VGKSVVGESIDEIGDFEDFEEMVGMSDIGHSI
jgi:hypothetical protein